MKRIMSMLLATLMLLSMVGMISVSAVAYTTDDIFEVESMKQYAKAVEDVLKLVDLTSNSTKVWTVFSKETLRSYLQRQLCRLREMAWAPHRGDARAPFPDQGEGMRVPHSAIQCCCPNERKRSCPVQETRICPTWRNPRRIPHERRIIRGYHPALLPALRRKRNETIYRLPHDGID